MAKTWTDMVNEAKAVVTGVSPAEAHQRLRDDEEALLIEVRNAESVPMQDR
jgi:predicted sulfurtransferase